MIRVVMIRVVMIWVVMIRVDNSESTAYRVFCELAQYLLSSICLQSIRFLSYVQKVRTKALVLKMHIVLTCEWKFHHVHELYLDPKT